MFCWSCGHENTDTHKYCGDCGKSLFKPERVIHEISTARTFNREGRQERLAPQEDAAAVPPPDSTLVAREVESPKPANPLTEEPRVVHEKPVPAALEPLPGTLLDSTPMPPPTPIRDRVPNRINGPSFLGLSDGTSDDYESNYLLDEEPEGSSAWKGYVLLAALVIISLLVIRNWQDVKSVATDYGQRLGLSDTAKKPAGPARVSSGNDASQLTPDAAATAGNSTTPSENKPADTNRPTDTAKLEKPQSDQDSSQSKPDDRDKPADQTVNETSKAAAGQERAAAPVDNSQLEEAQKYLQGRGVQQDCNRGLALLKSAANQPNAKARIQMAALYASGHCVTEDISQAYNWFAKAQELEPHNRMIERNMDSLWARMTDEERRKVLR